MVLVPFPGFLYLYNSHCYYYSNCHRSRPLPGVLISLRYIRLFRRILGVVLVPFPGFLYLYKNEQCNANWTAVLVPFPGFLYLYRRRKCFEKIKQFSSPSRGSYISTIDRYVVVREGSSSRPLPGVLISLRRQKIFIDKNHIVLVPFPGFLYLYVSWKNCKKLLTRFSSPSRGSYISTYIKMFWKVGDMFSSPSRGSYISTYMVVSTA